VAELLSGLLGINVAGTRGSLRRGHHLVSPRLVDKVPHVGADVDRLAGHLH
jgi:hypothetical protein